MNTIAIIGYGHLGKALKRGLLRSGVQKELIFVANNQKATKKVVSSSDIIFLTVKPKVVHEVVYSIKDLISDKLLISAAAAVSVSQIKKSSGNKNLKIIRIMPNIPIAYQSGVIGLYANSYVLPTEKKKIVRILAALGSVIECKKESELDAFTVLGGSGPAIAAFCIMLLIKAGKKLGLSKQVSEQIALQTCKGTITVLQESRQTAQELQQSVATKGGVTDSILQHLHEQKIEQQFVESLELGYDKIKRIKTAL
ncbi:MAG: NAD(P)-binding domain-containing protein [Candidatus Levybacteria bacterium]|nr:NAD(P)-binding domain-containing protein [Candidatus Levybacteria bacterium]